MLLLIPGSFYLPYLLAVRHVAQHTLVLCRTPRGALLLTLEATPGLWTVAVPLSPRLAGAPLVGPDVAVVGGGLIPDVQCLSLDNAPHASPSLLLAALSASLSLFLPPPPRLPAVAAFFV